MDQKPFNQQPRKGRLRIRNILKLPFLIGFGWVLWSLYGPIGSPAASSPAGYPVYQHDRLVRYWPGWDKTYFVFFFGDSYTSTRFLADRTPPHEGNPFGNPPFPGPAAHKRPLWSDFFITAYNQTFVKAINLAWGGATVDDHQITPFMDIIESFNRQVEGNFMKEYSKRGFNMPWQPYNALFVFWFGINDINNAWLWENRTATWDAEIQTYAKEVERVYQTGAKNFLFFNVPPIERSPETLELSGDMQKRKAADVANWNKRLEEVVYNFTKSHNDTTTFFWDSWKSYSEVLDNPCAHPETCVLKTVTGYCPEYAKGVEVETLSGWSANDPACEFPLKDYFWMDKVHHGYHMHNVTAQGVVKMLKSVPRNHYF